MTVDASDWISVKLAASLFPFPVSVPHFDAFQMTSAPLAKPT
jgi:hypothetical protein